MTFHTQAEIDSLFKNFEIEYFKEIDEEGFQAGGVPKHWYYYSIVDKK